ncbi:hypothetical protein ACXM1Q_001760 [Streptococcus sp. 10F2]
MSNYRVKHFYDNRTPDLEKQVNDFIKNNNIEVLKYTFHPIKFRDSLCFTGVLEYEVEEND